MRISFFYPPSRFFYAKNFFKFPITILDIGCSNDSPEVTKRWFPESTYHGVDITKRSSFSMDLFFHVTPNDFSGYEVIPNSYYDFVILNHVIEHLNNPATLINIVCSKLRPGGLLWIAFPSPASLNFPSGVGTLNFSDDPTHIHVCDVINISNQIIANGLKIIVAGKSRDRLRFFLGLCLYPLAYVTKLLSGRYLVKGLWYLYGFEDRIIAFKPLDS